MANIIILMTITIGFARGEWSAPDTIMIPCGKGRCDIWTEYCHFETCSKCNNAVCSTPLGPGGRQVQCYFYCMEVKKIMQMKELEDATSPAQQTSTDTIATSPAQQTIRDEAGSSPYVKTGTVLLVVLPMLSYVFGIATLAIYCKCRKRGKGGYSQDTMMKSHPPQGSHSGTTDPQDAAELAISAKLMPLE